MARSSMARHCPALLRCAQTCRGSRSPPKRVHELGSNPVKRKKSTLSHSELCRERRGTGPSPAPAPVPPRWMPACLRFSPVHREGTGTGWTWEVPAIPGRAGSRPAARGRSACHTAGTASCTAAAPAAAAWRGSAARAARCRPVAKKEWVEGCCLPLGRTTSLSLSRRSQAPPLPDGFGCLKGPPTECTHRGMLPLRAHNPPPPVAAPRA